MNSLHKFFSPTRAGRSTARTVAIAASAAVGVALLLAAPSAIAAGKKAPTPAAGAACASAGTTAKINAKSYTCAKNLGGKMVWMLANLAGAQGKSGTSGMSGMGATKPSIAGGNGPHPADEGSSADLARHKAMAAFQACLTQHGVTGGFGFGGPGRGPDDQRGNPGANPGTNSGANPMPSAQTSRRPFTQPSMSAAQQQAFTACASLMPAFGGPRPGDGPRPGASLALGSNGSTSATATPTSSPTTV